MKLIAFDTTEEACSVALVNGNRRYEHFSDQPRKHAELLLGMIEELLIEAGVRKHQLDAIAFSRGPGSFTGIRIATSAAQALGFSLELPVIPVSSLQGLAQGVYRSFGEAAVIALFDARMSEIYMGQYVLKNGIMSLKGEEALITPLVLTTEPGNFVLAGSGCARYEQKLNERFGQDIKRYPTAKVHARDIADIAIAFKDMNDYPVEKAMPVYLRNKVTS